MASVTSGEKMLRTQRAVTFRNGGRCEGFRFGRDRMEEMSFPDANLVEVVLPKKHASQPASQQQLAARTLDAVRFDQLSNLSGRLPKTIGWRSTAASQWSRASLSMIYVYVN